MCRGLCDHSTLCHQEKELKKGCRDVDDEKSPFEGEQVRQEGEWALW